MVLRLQLNVLGYNLAMSESGGAMRLFQRTLIAIGLLVVLMPGTGHAQEASMIGGITDATGGVLPGVTVTAVHEDTGNTFTVVTDEHGNYQLPLRSGTFTITVELSGFATLTRRITLLVGQQAVLNLQMAPSAVQETVTVTGAAPLLDVSQSKLSGNVDARQMQDLPVNGRNWMNLTLLVPGSQANAVVDAPIEREPGNGTMFFQLNVDGQQVGVQLGNSNQGQPRFSQDAIGEFEVITNRFDVTQGRSSGVQVNAVTRSGTNRYAGSFSGYFRDDRFNAADFVAHRVLPYSDQQLSGTVGGPLKKDRAHFFLAYEREREPQTEVFTSPYPSFNIPLTDTRKETKALLRFDVQLAPSQHLMMRANRWTHLLPFQSGGGTIHPSTVLTGDNAADQLFAQFTQTLGNNMVNEIRGGYNGINSTHDVYGWGGSTGIRKGSDFQAAFGSAPLAPGLLIPLDGAPPRILLRGYQLGGVSYNIGNDFYQLTDHLTYVLSKGGRHEFKIGGEYLFVRNRLFLNIGPHGTLDATGGPIPGNIEDLFPVWNDWTTWNLAALSPITRSWSKSFGDPFVVDHRDTAAAWFQDSWTLGALTLNLGIRYDVSLGAIGDRAGALPPFRLAQDITHDLLNVAPRLGFAYALRDHKTVIRGGYGKYFGESQDSPIHFTINDLKTVTPTVFNDGRPDFAVNPYNGQVPTYESIVASGARRDVGTNAIIDPKSFHTSYSHQASIGFQRQFGETMAVEADYAWVGSRLEGTQRNANLSYDPATGVNYPFTDISHLPYPDWGLAPMVYHDGRSDNHHLSVGLTKRFSDRWQAAATYSLAGLWDTPGNPPNLNFKVAPDLGEDYQLAATDQRHRATFNGIWELGYGFQASGVYFFGSGERLSTNYGGDLRQVGIYSTGRLRPDGTIAPRNNLVGDPIHRVDFRFERRFPLMGHTAVSGTIDVYNVFNHANYGSYVTAESNPNYGRPAGNLNIAYQPRIVQFGFRLVF